MRKLPKVVEKELTLIKTRGKTRDEIMAEAGDIGEFWGRRELYHDKIKGDK